MKLVIFLRNIKTIKIFQGIINQRLLVEFALLLSNQCNFSLLMISSQMIYLNRQLFGSANIQEFMEVKNQSVGVVSFQWLPHFLLLQLMVYYLHRKYVMKLLAYAKVQRSKNSAQMSMQKKDSKKNQPPFKIINLLIIFMLKFVVIKTKEKL